MLKDGVNRGEAMIRLASALRRGMTKAQLAKYGTECAFLFGSNWTPSASEYREALSGSGQELYIYKR